MKNPASVKLTVNIVRVLRSLDSMYLSLELASAFTSTASAVFPLVGVYVHVMSSTEGMALVMLKPKVICDGVPSRVSMPICSSPKGLTVGDCPAVKK